LLGCAVKPEAQWRKEVCLKEGQASIVDLPSGDQLIIQPEKGGLYLPTDHVYICFRQGGESFKPMGDSHTRSLKKWLQGQNIAPWERTLIPLLYCNDELVSVADLSYDKKFHGEINQTGWQVIWKR
jgi:tRNA(Ile)-lysidine synthetase-like protein